MVHCTNSPQNVRKITANRSPLQPRCTRQLMNRGIIATGNDCYLRFAARRTAPREAFGGYITFWHSTYPVPYPTWVGRMISSPTGRIALPGGLGVGFVQVQRASLKGLAVSAAVTNRAGQGTCWIGINPKGVTKNVTKQGSAFASRLWHSGGCTPGW